MNSGYIFAQLIRITQSTRRGTQQSWARLRPELQTLTLLYTFVDRKKRPVPFSFTLY